MVDLEQEIGDVKTDIVQIRRHFWDDVTVNLGTADDLVETHFSIRQQAEVLSERERRYNQSASALKAWSRLLESPYFGRIDFMQQGSDETEQIYLGTSSFAEDGTFLVYDWRAPISSLYYDHVPGHGEYAAPFGTVAGTMSLKRQFVIRQGQIELMFDAGVTIGDSLLMQVLSGHSDAHMKTIVATIQTEQNQIIRNDTSKLLVVLGTAGSGKTSAALQRIAFLLYKYRDVLQADQMVLFSPNPLFSSYVSTVLPELGEENMLQTTFQEYLEHRLGRAFHLEDQFDQMEYILTQVDSVDYNTRISGIRYKSSMGYMNTIQAYPALLEQEAMIFAALTFRYRVIVPPEQMRERFYAMDPSIRLINRVELLRDWLLKELTAFERSEINQAWVEDEIELLRKEDYLRAFKELGRTRRGKQTTFDDFDREKELLSRVVVKRRLKPLRHWIKQLRFVDVRKLYRQLFDDPALFARLSDPNDVPGDWSAICRMTTEHLRRSEISYEDATPFLLLMELLRGTHRNTAVRHVIVDEAQDYSPIQLALLKRLFPRSRMTTLGDLNQAVYAHTSALSELNALIPLYGREQTEIIQLTQSYRSTYEIVAFTRGMVPGGDSIVPFQRHGRKPRVIISGSDEINHQRIAADIRSLQSEGYQSIAVICKTAQESQMAHEALRDLPLARLITKDSVAFEHGILIIPSYLAKGVEFDAVLIFDGADSEYRYEHERKLFYTACTRAMHVLQVYVCGQPSPFIMEQAPDTYMLEPVRND